MHNLRTTKLNELANSGGTEASPARRAYRRPRPGFLVMAAIGVLTVMAVGLVIPTAPQVVRAAGDPVIAAAGDIACDPANLQFNGGNGSAYTCRQKYTSDLLMNAGLAAVLDLGDNQYFCGGYQAFLGAYDLSWGRVKSITRPVVGNHEYLTSGGTDCDTTNEGAAGYFKYFGSAAGSPGKGYYSYDVGAWHIIALNSNCPDAGGCGSSSAQYNWLKSDLEFHDDYCTLAYWHIPLFSSGGRAAINSQPFWNLLYSDDVDVILNGHDHIYERFAPQNPSGTADPLRGMREFIVGTGGANHTSITSIAANSEVRNTTTFGVLELTLHSTGYDWKFVPESGGAFRDAGSNTCHGPNAPATATPTHTATPTRTPGATRTPTGTPSPTGTPFTRTMRFQPVADAAVSSVYPNANFGTALQLRANIWPAKRSYIRFSVQGLNGQPVLGARLQLYITRASGSYLTVTRVTDNTWRERTITYNDAPTLGRGIGNSGTTMSDSWVSIDVSSYITGPGTYTFGIITPTAYNVLFDAREAGTLHAPQLVIRLAP